MDYKAEYKIEREYYNGGYTHRIYVRDMDGEWRWFGGARRRQFITLRAAERHAIKMLPGYTRARGRAKE